MYVLECICMYTLVCMDVKAWGACQVSSLLSTYVLRQCLPLNLELNVSPRMSSSLQRFPLFTCMLGTSEPPHSSAMDCRSLSSCPHVCKANALLFEPSSQIHFFPFLSNHFFFLCQWFSKIVFSFLVMEYFL